MKSSVDTFSQNFFFLQPHPTKKNIRFCMGNWKSNCSSCHIERKRLKNHVLGLMVNGIFCHFSGSQKWIHRLRPIPALAGKFFLWPSLKSVPSFRSFFNKFERAPIVQRNVSHFRFRNSMIHWPEVECLTLVQRTAQVLQPSGCWDTQSI